MNTSIDTISLARLSLAGIPILIICVVAYFWKLNTKTILYASIRMLLQLLAIGYVLIVLFEIENSLLICGILFLMMCMASWIAMRPFRTQGTKFVYAKLLGSLFFAASLTLLLVIRFILNHSPWYEPKFLIPLAGMAFSNAMNSLSLAGERFYSDLSKGQGVTESKKSAFEAALLPILNTFFAVGLVSIPGMMTGQILSDVSPLLAVRYQIVIMVMILSVSGLSVSLFLQLESQSTEHRSSH